MLDDVHIENLTTKKKSKRYSLSSWEKLNKIQELHNQYLTIWIRKMNRIVKQTDLALQNFDYDYAVQTLAENISLTENIRNV